MRGEATGARAGSRDAHRLDAAVEALRHLESTPVRRALVDQGEAFQRILTGYARVRPSLPLCDRVHRGIEAFLVRAEEQRGASSALYESLRRRM